MITIKNIKKDYSKVLKQYNPDLTHSKALDIIAKSLGYNSFRKMKSAYLMDETTGEVISPAKNYSLQLSQCDISKRLLFNEKILRTELNISVQEVEQLKYDLGKVKR